MKHIVIRSVVCILVGVALSASAQSALPNCDPDDGGIDLPPGFCALVVADDLGPARHMAVAVNGVLYVAVRNRREPGAIVALRDTNGDGRADVEERFDGVGGTGLRLRDVYRLQTAALGPSLGVPLQDLRRSLVART